MTINVSLNSITNLNNTTAVSSLNANSSLITGGFTTALNTSGDQMQGTLDMNSNQVINLPTPATANSPARLQDLSTIAGGGTVTNIPSGGASGQVLIKSGTTPFVTAWGNAGTTNVAAGTGLALSGTTLSVATTGVATGTFGAAASVPVLVVNAQGQITSVTTVASAAVGGGAASGTYGSTGTTVQIVVNSAGNVSSVTNVGIGIAGSQIISGTVAGSVMSSVSLGAGNVNGGVSGTLPAANMILTDITTLASLASLGTITTGTWNNATGVVTSASGMFTTITTTNIKASGSALMPDNSVWSASGITNATGVTLTINSATGPTQGAFLIGLGAAACGYNVVNYGANGINGFVTYGGTPTSPTSLSSGSFIGTLAFGGYNGTAVASAKARIAGLSIESGNWTAGASGTGLEFDTTASGGTARTQAMRLMSGLVIGSGTTDPGAGIFVSTPYTVTSLPAGVTGSRAFVTDSQATTYMSTVSGGGTACVPVFFNGTNWKVA
jgi:hypothetical protein